MVTAPTRLAASPGWEFGSRHVDLKCRRQIWSRTPGQDQTGGTFPGRVAMFLNAAADKLKREQEKRKADLAKRQAAERRAKMTADAHRREREDLARRERQEEAQRRAEAHRGAQRRTRRREDRG